MSTPTVGRIVHFYAQEAGKAHVDGPFAAIVTGSDDKHLYLTAFPPVSFAGGLPFFETLPLAENEKLDQDLCTTWWCWPPKV